MRTGGTIVAADLDIYRRPGMMTAAGAHGGLFDDLPDDVAGLARVIHGLLLHEHWAPAYGVTLTNERRAESHIRPVEQMLARMREREACPLSAARPLGQRLVGTCRNFSVLLVAMLRAKGLPARARCGFGSYFERGKFVDHWVGEYWHAREERWVLVDAQLDEVQCGAIKPDFDPLDVPRDRFVIAGDAWALCRDGTADPANFGILDMSGMWFIAGNVMRDLASLANMEMLPWDVWGAMPQPGDKIGEDVSAFFDRLAALTRARDVSFADVQALYEGDDRLRVPATVFNAVTNRQDTIG
jgi:hypothetical protein